MNIYNLLQHCIKNNQSVKITIFNKYKNYSFYVVFLHGQYYLFFDKQLIEPVLFISYMLTFETFISTNTNLYSDFFLNYNFIEPETFKHKLEMDISNFKAQGVSSEVLSNMINTSYKRWSQIKNIDLLDKKTSIKDIKNAIHKFLQTDTSNARNLRANDIFFQLLAKKINKNFYINRNNLINLFADAMLDNQDLIVHFNLGNVDYEIRFSFTDANNLQATVDRTNQIYIGSRAFAILYVLSIFYNEDYENTFFFQKVPSKRQRTNRQTLLNAYLLNELINQNKNNNSELLGIVHNYYAKTGLFKTNLAFLIIDIEKVINGDSEFQDYSEDKATIQKWLINNSNMLLGISDTANEQARRLEQTSDTAGNDEPILSKKPKLIYWPKK